MSELGIIEWMQGASPMLDPLMISVTYAASNATIWLIAAFLMTCSMRYRRIGVAVIVALAVTYIVVDLVMKPVFDRPRPFEVEDLVPIVDPPTSASFPSGHTAHSFAAAFCIFYYNRRWGIPALAFASLVGVSRIYLGVHWPTDVLAGVIVGVAVAYAAIWFMDRRVPYFQGLPDPRVRNDP